MPDINRIGDQPHPVDKIIGENIRARRKALGLSQSKLADAIGVTFQQVQKYERGANRVSGSVLYMAGKAMGCHPGEFYSGLEDLGDGKIVGSDQTKFFATEGASSLADAFITLPRPAQRAVINLTRELTGAVNPAHA